MPEFLTFSTGDEVRAWAEREYGATWLRELTQAQIEALAALKSDAFAAINYYLRTGLAPRLPSVRRLQRWIEDANAALAVRPLPEAVVAYRGVTLRAIVGDVDLATTIGATFRDPGFVSTTLWRPVARRFARDLLVLTVPVGIPAAWMEHFASRNEYELLLSTGTLLVVEGFEVRDQARILQVRVEGREP